MLAGSDRIWKLDLLNVVGERQERGVGSETANSEPTSIVGFDLIRAESRDEMASPAESGRSNWKVFGFVLLEGLEPIVDPRSSYGWSAVVQEWDEVSGQIDHMSNLVQLVPDSSG